MSDFGSPLFLRSSPAAFPSRNLNEDVRVLVEKARETLALNLAVHNLLESCQDAFFDIFSRQIELINSRSQDFQDAQITIFDKALLVLTDHPNCLMNPAAVKFFCEEYFNIDLGRPVLEVTHALRQSVQIPEALKQALPSSDDATMIDQEAEPKTSRPSPLNPNLRKDMEPKLATLWSVYESAREDYVAALGNTTAKEKTISTAKFLRDTAENIILYLKNKNADALMIAELETTFSHAKTTVVCLTGGKNRKFDRAEIDKVKGVPRGPSLPTRSREQTHGRQYLPPAEVSNRYGGNGQETSYGASRPDHGADEHDVRGQARYCEPSSYQNPNPHRNKHPVPAKRGRDRGSSYTGERYSYTVTASGAEHYRRRRRSEFEEQARDDSQSTPDSKPRRVSDLHASERSASPNPSSKRKATDRYRGRSRSRTRKHTRHSASRSPPHRSSKFEERSSRHGPDARDNDQGAILSTSYQRPKIPMNGRGHSGVPYGYTGRRLMDSYVPRRDRDHDDDNGDIDEGEI